MFYFLRYGAGLVAGAATGWAIGWFAPPEMGTQSHQATVVAVVLMILTPGFMAFKDFYDLPNSNGRQ